MEDTEKTECLHSVVALIFETMFQVNSYQEFRLAMLRDARGDYGKFTNFCRIAYKNKTCVRTVDSACRAVVEENSKTCYHCKRSGHVEKECYFKYPHLKAKAMKRKNASDHEPKNNKQPRIDDPAQVTAHLQRLIDRLQNSANYARLDEEYEVANMAESDCHTQTLSNFLVDSGASQHCIGDDTGLVKTVETQRALYLADGRSIDVTKIGHFPMDIGKVLVAPKLTQPLISTGSLAMQGYKTTFDKNEVRITHDNGLSLEGEWTRRGYFLTKESVDILFGKMDLGMAVQVEQEEDGAVVYTPGPLQQLHLAFGHIDASRLKRYITNGSLRVAGVTATSLTQQEESFICPGCHVWQAQKKKP